MRGLATLVVLFALPAAAQSPATAASVTEPGRTLLRPLDIVLAGRSAEPTERTLLVVVDPTAALTSAGFVDAFANALQQNRATLARTRLGLGIVGQKGCVVVPPTADHPKVLDALRVALRTPAGEFQNVFADLRAAAAAFAGGDGDRVLLLVTLENGYVEDDVEQTATLLHKARIRVEVLKTEATLADSYWAAHEPRKANLTGADGAVIDLPWGWLFQIDSANESTPAGFAMWGLNRLASATGGRVFLHSTASQLQHQCNTPFACCLFCNGDHLPPDDHWNKALVDQLGPLACSRADTFQALGDDPYFRLTVEAWRSAAEAGLLRSQPAVRVTGTSAKPNRAWTGRDLDLTDSAHFERQASRAEGAAAKAQQLGDQLEAQITRVPAGSGSPRQEAAARYTRVLLQLTRVNLLCFAAWCRESAPGLFGEYAPLPVLPEVPGVNRAAHPVGIRYRNLSLCHGVRPFFAVELPGGARLRPELEKLDAQFTAYLARYGESQFGYALRRNSIAQFDPICRG
ncbi:MAG: hypothetical protein FJ265_22130, partial [Planctomycetes bacterium]|nr:hypothetical protein [Planctomycetota bacterium]